MPLEKRILVPKISRINGFEEDLSVTVEGLDRDQAKFILVYRRDESVNFEGLVDAKYVRSIDAFTHEIKVGKIPEMKAHLPGRWDSVYIRIELLHPPASGPEAISLGRASDGSLIHHWDGDDK